MKFKNNDRIIKNDKFFNDESFINIYDKTYKTVYKIDIASTSGQFYTFKNDITKTTYPSYIVDYEFEIYNEELDRKYKILSIKNNIYK